MSPESTTFINKSVLDLTQDTENSSLTVTDTLTNETAERTGLQASELFSLFTADIIKEKVVFTR